MVEFSLVLAREIPGSRCGLVKFAIVAIAVVVAGEEFGEGREIRVWGEMGLGIIIWMGFGRESG